MMGMGRPVPGATDEESPADAHLDPAAPVFGRRPHRGSVAAPGRGGITLGRGTDSQQQECLDQPHAEDRIHIVRAQQAVRQAIAKVPPAMVGIQNISDAAGGLIIAILNGRWRS